MGDQSVIIFVGPERKRYLIHKTLLTNQSEYFDKALNGPFKEADEQSIYLEEETPAAFDLLVGWLYQNSIPVVGPLFADFKSSKIDSPSGSPQTRPFTGRYEGIFSQFPQVVDMPLADPLEVNEGTTKTPYQPTTMPPGNGPAFGFGAQHGFGAPPATFGAQAGGMMNEVFGHISCQQEYCHWSPEELRLADYRIGKSGFAGSPEKAAFGRTEGWKILQQHLPRGEGSSVNFVNTGRIPGIPQCPSMHDISATEELHQIAVLQLCLMAETLCWNNLFNDAMTAYMQGESNLSHRSVPASHIELIYQRAHEESPCRSYAADAAVSRLRDSSAQEQYQELCNEYPAFLKDIFASLGRVPMLLAAMNPAKMPTCAYHVHLSGDRCPIAKEEGQPSAGWMFKPHIRVKPKPNLETFRQSNGLFGPSQSSSLSQPPPSTNLFDARQGN